MKHYRKILRPLAVFVLLFSSLTVLAQGGSSNRQETPGHQVEQPAPNSPGNVQFLTGPNQGAPLDIALDYIRKNRTLLSLTGADIADMIVTDQYTSDHNGVTHIYLRQRFNGIEVINGNININVAADGSIMNLGNSFVTNLPAAIDRQSPGRTAVQSVEAAARHLGLRITQPVRVEQVQGGQAREMVLSDGGISLEPIPARLVYQPVADNAVRLAWNLEIAEVSGEHWWNMVVDATSGTVLAQIDYVDHDHWGDLDSSVFNGPLPVARTITAVPQNAPSMLVDGAAYNVFAMPKESPSDGPRTLEVDPAHPVASPFGWHDTNGAVGPEFTRTRGNNVHAYTDVDANNVADPGSDPDGGPSLYFDFPLDLGQNPPDYRPAAVVNLFYWNNIIHDVFYGYGFNEMSGNFQVNNYGRGPTSGNLGANDDVRAEAQDGSGTNNANFATPVDGSRPRMQMFVWTYPFVNLVTVNAPSPVAGDYAATNASFGPQLTVTGPRTADVILALDPANAAGPSETDGCSPLTNAAEVAGKIALLDRGTCPFVDKVFNAQNAGAIGVIVANNAPGAPITMGFTAPIPTIIIPSVMVSQDNGNLLKANLPLNATLSDAGALAINRDSDLDNGVIVHEYGHGISNRLTGGRTNVSCLGNQEQMGEGWSDWLGLVLTTHPDDTAMTPRGIGTYVIYQPTDGNGIRPTPYTKDMAINPSTYDTIKNPAITVPHGIGYVWSTMLWDVYWNLVHKHGYNPDVYGNWTTGGNNLAIQLVMDGMKLQPCQPGFVTGRNAILQADQALTGGANQCEIWQGFARRGLGVSASQGSSNNRNDGVQAFDLPPVCVPTLSLTAPSPTQYSDPITLNATVSPLLFGGLPVTGSVEFFINGSSVGTSAINSSGQATLSVPNTRAAGNYNVTATFSPSGPEEVNSSSAGPLTLTVTKENAASTYTGDQFITTAGPNINTAPVLLAANLTQEDDGYPGDITLAHVVFELFKSGNMGNTPDQTVGNVPVDAAGNAQIIVDLSADIWTVKVKIEPANSYWTANPVGIDIIMVAVGSTDRRVTGGGWVPDGDSSNGKGNFGFTVSPQRNGNPRGNAIFVFRGNDGYEYVVKSTSWQGGSLVFLGNPITGARFNGRATVQKIDPATGEIVASFGNYSFIVDIEDGDLLNPKGPDYYGIRVFDNNGNLWHQVGAPGVPVQLGGGNVAIKG